MTLPWGARAAVMGVINITPDSFSDGGRCSTPERALAQARRLLAQGADLLDLGAQSTRPGALMVGPEEELRRLLPVLEALQPLRAQHPELRLSIDTFEAAVAEAALAAGGDWINDVRGANATSGAPGGSLRDPAMFPLIARAGSISPSAWIQNARATTSAACTGPARCRCGSGSASRCPRA